MGWPNDRQLTLPGLKTPVDKVYLLTAPGKPLKHQRKGRDVILNVPEKAVDPDATVVVVELQGPPEVDPYEIRPDGNGRIELHVYLADLRSRMGQRAYLDHFHRRTMLANWQNVNDFPEWKFTTDAKETYEVLASYASMWGGKAGFELEIDERRIPGVMANSPSLYFPETFFLGKIDLEPGNHTVRFKISCVVNNHALNLEKVILVPVAE
jgi:hypothetical protein